MKTIIIGVGIIVLLFLCLVLAIKYAAKKSEEAKDNKKIADAYKQNAEEIKNYTEKVQEEKEISNAKTKEDLRSHARNTANSNNDKLRKQTESKQGAATKTRKTRAKSTGK